MLSLVTHRAGAALLVGLALAAAPARTDAQEVLVRITPTGNLQFFDADPSGNGSPLLGSVTTTGLPSGRRIVGAWPIDLDAGLFGAVSSDGSDYSALERHVLDLDAAAITTECSVADGQVFPEIAGVDSVWYDFVSGELQPLTLVERYDGDRWSIGHCSTGTSTSSESDYTGQHLAVTTNASSAATGLGITSNLYLPETDTLHVTSWATAPASHTAWTFEQPVSFPQYSEHVVDPFKHGSDVFTTYVTISNLGGHAAYTWYLKRATLGDPAVEVEWDTVGSAFAEYEGWYAAPVPGYMFMLPEFELTASDGSSTSEVAVAWDDVYPTDSYRVLRRLAGSSSSPSVISSWLSGTSFDDTTAAPGVEYEYFVEAALDTDDESTYIRSAGDPGHACTAPPAILAQPQSDDVCVGDPATLAVTADGFGHALTYQWHRDGTPIAGATSDTLALGPASLSDDGSYTVVIGYASGLCGITTSSAAVLDVVPEPSITSISGDVDACEGSDVTLSVGASGGAGHALAYQWSLDGSPITGETGTSLALTDVDADDIGTYSVDVQYADGLCGTASDTVDLDVVEALELTSSLADSGVCPAGSVTFSVAVTGDADETLVYAWSHDGTAITGATGSTLTITNASSADEGTYAVTVAYADGPCTDIATSSASLHLVDAPTSVSASQGTSTSAVLLDWDDEPGAAAYVVQRATSATATPSDVSGPLTTSSWNDTTGVPGQSYWYSVVAAPNADGSGACDAAGPVEGWIALTPPSDVAATDGEAQLDSVDVTWTHVSGATHYRVWRETVGGTDDPLVVHADWLPAGGGDPETYSDHTALPLQTYRYRIEAAVGDAGLHASDPDASSSDTGWRICLDTDAAWACKPDEAGPLLADQGPATLMLIDRSAQMSAAACADALDAARDDLDNFEAEADSEGLTGRVAVWTFADNCIVNLTGGFGGVEQARHALDLLDANGCAGLAPLANALGHGLDTIADCSVFFDPGNGLLGHQRIVTVYTAGVNDHMFPGSLFDGLPDATSGDCSSGFVPAAAWENVICALAQQDQTLLVHEWTDAPALDSGAGLLAALAAATGGVYDAIAPGGSPVPFFGDCNGNGIDDALDIATATSDDCDGDGVPDECQTSDDCDGDGVLDACELAQGAPDLDGDGRPDACQGFDLTAPTLDVAGTPLPLHVVGGPPSGLVVVVAGFVPGSLPMPGCPESTIAILDFAAYGAPLTFWLPTGPTGHVGVEIPVPATAAGVDVLFQALDPGACATSEVRGISLLP